jgi:hypothetical protein
MLFLMQFLEREYSVSLAGHVCALAVFAFFLQPDVGGLAVARSTVWGIRILIRLRQR